MRLQLLALLGAAAALMAAPLAAHRIGEPEDASPTASRQVAQAAAPGPAAPGPAAPGPAAPGVTGQAPLRFKIFKTRELLPPEAQAVLVKAHGGFAVDRRAGKGETYFALPGAGIIQLSADLKSAKLIPTAPEVRDTNMHNAKIWYAADGQAYLTFPANDASKVFTTTLEGKLVSTLDPPTPDTDFDEPKVNAYFRGNGKFVPTDVEVLDGLFYITTGYSALDYVLTARAEGGNPFNVKWNDLAFGGKGTGLGQFGTGHGITVPPGTKALDVADRPRSEIDRFTRYGHYRSTLSLPAGTLPCDTDFEDVYETIGCLEGADKTKGAPIFLLKEGTIVSTIMAKEDLGLDQFTHIHNAVARVIGGKVYVIAQAWNPGDFAIFEQVIE